MSQGGLIYVAPLQHNWGCCCDSENGLVAAMSCLPHIQRPLSMDCTEKILPLVRQAQAAPAHARLSQACPTGQRMSCCATSQRAQVCLLSLYNTALQLTAQRDVQPRRQPPRSHALQLTAPDAADPHRGFTCASTILAAIPCSSARTMLRRSSWASAPSSAGGTLPPCSAAATSVSGRAVATAWGRRMMAPAKRPVSSRTAACSSTALQWQAVRHNMGQPLHLLLQRSLRRRSSRRCQLCSRTGNSSRAAAC